MRHDGFKMIGLLFVGILLAVLGGGQAFAQQAAAPAATERNTIFDYKAELKLTDQQEQQIRQFLTELSGSLDLQRARITIATHELAELLKKEAPLEQIKKQLEQEAALRAALSYEDISASRRINAVLSAEQLKHWRNIQETSRQGRK